MLTPVNKRSCLWCCAPLQGRIDKKFCSDCCRSCFNQSQNRYSEQPFRDILRILKNNRRLLARFQNQPGLTLERLEGAGFEPAYFTHVAVGPGQMPYSCCFEFGFTIDAEKVTIKMLTGTKALSMPAGLITAGSRPRV